MISSTKKIVYEMPNKLPNYLSLRILEISEIFQKSLICKKKD